MSEIKMKTCKECKIDKPITDYYMAVKDDKYPRCHPRCKPCHNTFSRQYRKSRPPQGFAALPKEIRDDILVMRKEGATLKAIASKYDIKYSKFTWWKRAGKLCVCE